MRVLLGFGLGQNLKLILKIDDSFLVLLAEHVGGFLRFHVDIFEQFPQFGQLGVAFLVHFQLLLASAFSFFQTILELDDLDAQIGLVALHLATKIRTNGGIK